MREFTKEELFDGVRLPVTFEQLEAAGVEGLCAGTRKAERTWLVMWSNNIEVMGSWNGDADCIETVCDSWKPHIYKALKDLFQRRSPQPHA